MNTEFEVFTLTAEKMAESLWMSNLFDKFLGDILTLMGEENNIRYKSIVRTKLEEACFFAQKGLALSD